MGTQATHKAIQFGNDGLSVDLPWPASSVRLNVATLDTPITISALDQANTKVDEKTVSKENNLCTVVLTGKAIIKVTLEGGGNHGLLNQLSIVI